MAKSDRTGDTQYAALPYRRTEGGVLLVLLLTSRETKRWVIPKGWPMTGHKPYEVAATEAYQEAGIKGIVGQKSIGTYYYTKRLMNEEDRLCEVIVFSLRVTHELPTWREETQRQRAWFPRDTAASLVDEGGLAEIIDRLS
jgi:8-oxo-dGTP pyrophosphatase MutT (NUDIX family)